MEKQPGCNARIALHDLKVTLAKTLGKRQIFRKPRSDLAMPHPCSIMILDLLDGNAVYTSDSRSFIYANRYVRNIRLTYLKVKSALAYTLVPKRIHKRIHGGPIDPQLDR
jgi:hypothetical protein